MSTEQGLVQLGRGVMDLLLMSSDVIVLSLYSLGGLWRSGMLDWCIAAFGGCIKVGTHLAAFGAVRFWIAVIAECILFPSLTDIY